MTRRPHLVLVVLDTVRADGAGLGQPGRSPMPALQSFAKSAAVYPETYSSSPWTLPSHASLFTGAWVWRHGCHEGNRRLDTDLATLAERLDGVGYATGAVSANAWVGPDFGFHRGFQRFVRAWQLVDSAGDLAGLRRASRETGRTDVGEALRRARTGGFAPAVINEIYHLLWRRRGRFAGERVARRSVALAREMAAGGQPVFLFANFLDAHLPYRAPRRYRQAALGRDVDRAGGVNQDPWAYIGGRVPMTEEDLGLLRALYLAELTHLDDVIAGFLIGIDAVLDPDRTVLAVTSDHGEHLGEHGLMDHQYSLGERLIQVPLAVRCPGREGVGVHPGLRQNVDVAPTLLEAAGLPLVDDAGIGRPLSAGPRPWVLAEYLGPQPTMQAHARRGEAAPFQRFDRALRALRMADGRKVVVGSDGSTALYDLSTDGEELRDVSAERPAEARELADQLAELGPGQSNGKPVPVPVPALDSLDPGVARALESLGYLQ